MPKGVIVAGFTDREALIAALRETDQMTVTWRVNFNEQNYSVMPLGGARWRRNEDGELVKENVFDEVFPEVRIAAPMRRFQQ